MRSNLGDLTVKGTSCSFYPFDNFVTFNTINLPQIAWNLDFNTSHQFKLFSRNKEYIIHCRIHSSLLVVVTFHFINRNYCYVYIYFYVYSFLLTLMYFKDADYTWDSCGSTHTGSDVINENEAWTQLNIVMQSNYRVTTSLILCMLCTSKVPSNPVYVYYSLTPPARTTSIYWLIWNECERANAIMNCPSCVVIGIGIVIIGICG